VWISTEAEISLVLKWSSMWKSIGTWSWVQYFQYVHHRYADIPVQHNIQHISISWWSLVSRISRCWYQEITVILWV
jgi:hypothetical protein